jgi:hypothetical protein
MDSQKLVAVCRLCYNVMTRVISKSNVANGEARHVQSSEKLIQLNLEFSLYRKELRHYKKGICPYR